MKVTPGFLLVALIVYLAATNRQSVASPLAGWRVDNQTNEVQGVLLDTSLVQAVLKRGPGLHPVDSPGYFDSCGWSTNTTVEPDKTTYFSFVLDSRECVELERMKVCLSSYGPGGLSGARTVELRYGPDFTNSLGATNVTDLSQVAIFDLTEIPALNGNLELRLYGYNALSATESAIMGLSDTVLLPDDGPEFAVVLERSGPPQITQEPVGAFELEGGSLELNVTADSKQPLAYQWLFGGVALAGATASTLFLNNLASADAGGYSVRVSDGCGAVTSQVAVLTVGSSVRYVGSDLITAQHWLAPDIAKPLDGNADGVYGTDGYLIYGYFEPAFQPSYNSASTLELLPSYIGSISEPPRCWGGGGSGNFGWIADPFEPESFLHSCTHGFTLNGGTLILTIVRRTPQPFRLGVMVSNDDFGFAEDIEVNAGGSATVRHVAPAGHNAVQFHFFDISAGWANITVTVGNNSRDNPGVMGFTFDRVSAYAQAVLADHPLVYYQFGEKAGGTACDATTNGFHGTYVQVDHVANVSVALSSAAAFNGINSSVIVPALSRGSRTNFSQFSIELWVNVNAFQNSAGLSCLYDRDEWVKGAPHLQITTGSLWEFSLCDAVPQDLYFDWPWVMGTNQWYHVVTVYDATARKVSFYGNGKLVSESGCTNDSPVVLGAAHIGAWNGNSRCFKGCLDEFAIYDQALSADRIAAHFQTAASWSGLRRQVYTNIVGANVTDLTANARFPNAPDAADSVPSLESQYLPDGAADNYGQRLTGWLVPPRTGSYAFYLAADDAAQVYLSTDESPSNKRLILEATSWSPDRTWTRKSPDIALVAGSYYYLEVLHKEESGGDNVAVAWKLPGGTEPKDGDEPIGGGNLVFQARMPEVLWSVDPPGSGMVSLSPVLPAREGYDDGAVVTFTAVAAQGYRFAYWSGKLSDTNNPATMKFKGTPLAVAHFVWELGDVTQPGDLIVPTAGSSPGDEGVAKAIDNNTSTKYYNLDKLNTGFTVTPGMGPTVVTGLGLTSANDCPERDPASFRLEGSMNGANFSLIASNTVPAFLGRFQQQNFFFTNLAAYSVYRLTFPTVANAATATGMQIAEVQFFGRAADRLAISATADPPTGGTVDFTPSLPGLRYTNGAALTLTARAASGYQFDHWTEGGTEVSRSAAYSFSVSAARNLVAHFVLLSVSYRLSCTASPPGAGDIKAEPPLPSDGNYAAGTSVRLTASPAGGYEFSRWGGGVSDTSITIQVTVSINLNITAYFIQTPVSPYLTGLRRQIYTNVLGASVANLIDNAKFPLAPDVVDTVSALESQYLPNDAGDNYGQRLTGWLVPPLTGTYAFYLAADDAAQVFLSSDESPYNKRLIVDETAWTSYRTWAQMSPDIALVAGNRYYLEVLHKEDTGGDHVAVAWKRPGGAEPKNGDPPIGGSNVVYQAQMPEMVWAVEPPGSGSVSLSPLPPTSGRYTNGTLVTLDAVATNGYRFANWSGALTGTVNPAKLTISGTPVAIAHFVTDLTDVTQPGDPIVPSSSNSPSDEGVANAIDNSTATKYFNFDKLNTGFTVTPKVGPTLVVGLGLTSASDAPDRDPASYRLEGRTMARPSSRSLLAPYRRSPADMRTGEVTSPMQRSMRPIG